MREQTTDDDSRHSAGASQRYIPSRKCGARASIRSHWTPSVLLVLALTAIGRLIWVVW